MKILYFRNNRRSRIALSNPFKSFTGRSSVASALCTVILLFSVYHLNVKSRRIFNRNEIHEANIKGVTVCVPVKSYHCAGYLNVSAPCSRLNALYQHLKTEPNLTPRKVSEFVDSKKLSEFFRFVPRFSKVTTHLNANHICFLYSNNTQPEKRTVQLVNTAKVSATIFLNDDLDRIDTSFNGEFHRYHCDDFKKCPGQLVGDFRIKFHFLPAPYSTKCRDYANESLPFATPDSPIQSRHQCVIECVKQKYRLSRFFYSSSDDQTYKFDEHEPMILPNDRELIRRCSTTCNRRECVNSKYLKKNIFIKTHVRNRLIIEREQTFFEEIAVPLIPDWTFWLHLFSLLGCLFGISLVELFNSLISILKRLFMLGEHRKVVRYMNYVKWAIITVISLACSGFLVCLLVVNENKVETIRIDHFNTSKYTLLLCFPLFQALQTSPYRHTDYLGLEQYVEFNNILEDTTLDELKRNLLDLNSFLIDHDADWIINTNRTLLYYKDVCWKTEIDFGGKKVIHMNLTTTYKMAYLKFVDQTRFNTLIPKMLSSVRLSWSFETKIDQCLDYGRHTKTNSKHGKAIDHECSSRIECIDRCYLHGFTRRHGKLPFYLLFDEDFEWFGNLKFHDEFDTNLKNECNKKFSLPDCRRTIYHRNDDDSQQSILNPFEYDKTLIIHRPTFGEYLVHQKAYHLNDLAIDFFNIFSTLGLISYGISALKNRRTNTGYLKAAHLKTIVKVLCVMLFVFHLAMIFISFDETYESAHFAGDPRQADLPILNVCIDLEDDAVRGHFKMEKPDFAKDGHQLEQLTRQIEISNLIDRIQYIDRDYTLQNRTLSEVKDETIILSHFFLDTKKCFSIELNIDPEDIRLQLLDYIISLKFNEQLENLQYELVIYHRLSSMESLRRSLEHSARFEFARSYEIQLKIVYRIYYDFFDSKIFESFETTKTKFRKATGFSTTLLPLKRADFENQLNDELFASRLLNRTDSSSISTTVVYFKHSESSDYYNLRLAKSLMIYVRKTEKKKNFNTIFIEVLNCLSLWFDLCLLEIVGLFVCSIRALARRLNINNRIGPRV